MTVAAWTIDGTHARFDLGRFVASVDLEHVDQGLRFLPAMEHSDSLPFGVLRLESPSLAQDNSTTSPIDFYSRGQDLVAAYREDAGQRRRLQVYWRPVDTPYIDADTAVIELVVSVQTELLDSNPAMCVASQFPSGEVLNEFEVGSTEHDRQFVLVRPETQPLSVMQAVHPSDRSGNVHLDTVDGEEAIVVRHPLFAEQLEKGVIRRARVLVAILPRAGDLQLALDCYDAFAASEPMLTA